MNNSPPQRMISLRPFAPERIPFERMGVSEFPWPQWAGPIDLEIGGGAGLFAIQRSLEFPDRLLVSLERTDKVLRLLRRAHSHGNPANLIGLRADAVGWIARNVPERRIENVFILYPNPYPRPKQSNLRWASMPFMGFLKTRLCPQGRVCIATNKVDYATWTKEWMPKWGFERIEERRVIGVSPRTHFEKKYLERGDACLEMIFCPKGS